MGLVARRVIVTLVALLLSFAQLGEAQAQSTNNQETPELSEEEKTSKARTLFGLALQRIDSGRFAEARDLLDESLSLVPRAGTAFNLAVASRGTGDLLAAQALLQELLDGKFGALSQSQRADASALNRELGAQIGALIITLKGAPQAEVRIDGDRAGEVEGTGDPLSVPVNPGRRIVTVTAMDHKDEEQSVRVEPGAQIPLAFEMALTEDAKTGRLIVDAASKEDRVEVLGVGSSLGHIDRRVPPGTYTVKVSNDRGSRKTTLTVKPRGTTRFQFDDVNTSLLKKPIFWAGVGAVIAGTVLAIVLTRPSADSEEPLRDPTYDVVEARIRWP